MAVVKVCKGGKSLGKLIDYAAKDKLTSGKDCSDNPKKSLEEMQTTKEIWEQEKGRQYKHYVQSFAPKETTPEEAHKIGREWAEKNFKGYEVFIGTHNDKEHIHNHFIVNSVNFENGKKIHLDKEDLEKFKAVSDEICKEHGLSVIDRNQSKVKGEVREYNMKKYQAIVQGKSYITDTALAVQKSLENAKNKEEFMKNMNDNGYKVDWQDHKKHITFEDKDGHKVRAANLEKTFNESGIGKDGIIQQLEHNRKIEIEQEHKNEITFIDKDEKEIDFITENEKVRLRERTR